MALDRPLVRAPEFPPVEWLNAPAPPSLADLRGQVVLVELWDFTCINCLRTLPTLRDWNMRYEDSGLVTLGVHTPEFPFARDPQAVRRAIGRLGIRWPVALDNDQKIWVLFANHVWPTVYLVDRAGYIRFRREGEGGYFELEAAIRALLTESRPGVAPLPPPLTSDQEQPGGGISPELQIEAVGSGPVPEDDAISHAIPEHRTEGSFYVEGEWKAVRRGLTLESEHGGIVLPFQAFAVHAVMAVEGNDPGVGAWLEASLDGQSVPSGCFGQDLQLLEGATGLRVDTARSYDILQSVAPGLHELRLRLVSPGTTLYAFSFDPCLQPPSFTRSDPC
ncbi:MAG: DipZ protein [Anaerolineales bacterium]|nr:DipZ protein [Anaerolineales bacterium]